MADTPVTLITGARKGIGRALAEHYLTQGHRVYGCSRKASDLDAGGYRHVCLDVTDEAAVRGMLSEIRRDAGRLDHLINNAGIASMNHALLTPIDTVRSILDTNVTATFLFCRDAAKIMKGRSFGRIVNLISVAEPLRIEGEAIYAASKSAVRTLTEILARELAPFGITVNAVGPTPVATDLLRGVPEDRLAALVERQAIRRMGTTDDVANVVDFFLRKESGFVTAQSIFLGGVC
ncbi:MAG: SDR family oxidoreductase [Acidimicrobiia bacterium]|nr:SDR family oxidoreductase [Acidimicrobiia bacterium]